MTELNPWYLVAVLGTILVITFALRALPFAILEPLRASGIVRAMALWMPAGILVILALTTFRGALLAEPHAVLHAFVAAAVTIVVHLWGGRRTLLSIGAGTLTYVLLVNLL